MLRRTTVVPLARIRKPWTGREVSRGNNARIRLQQNSHYRDSDAKTEKDSFRIVQQEQADITESNV